jgi:glyceraldehyde 3-phosphate dehydrogenase
MAVRLAVNGLGRIGRALFRVAFSRHDLEVVAVNELVEASLLARLLAHDTVHGPFPAPVAAKGEGLVVDGRQIPVYHQPGPKTIPWPDAGPQVVVEATGRFGSRQEAEGHLRGSVERVVISANTGDADATFCPGVNTHLYDPQSHVIISTASCTTNCIAPVARVLEETFGIQRVLINSVHSYTNNQRLLDQPHPDPRRARAAAMNIIPTTTGAAAAVATVLPDLAGRIHGMAVRVPTPDVSMLDLVAQLRRPATTDTLAQSFRQAAEGELREILAVTEEELVSSDFVGDPHSAVVDLPLLQVTDDTLIRVVAWYDNEWGYANRLADMVALVGCGGKR